jgi:hypothetical protein
MSKKKSPKPPKHVPWTQQPPATIYAAFTADRLYHVSTERAFAEQEARGCLRSAQVFAYTRIPADEGKKLEEIRKMAERWKRRFWEANRGKDEAVCGMAAAGMMILRILESTPTAKGRRGK